MLKGKKLTIAVVAVLLLIILYPGLCYVYWGVRAFFDPLGAVRIQDEYRRLSSEVLIKKLHSIDPVSLYPTVAMEVLAERKEKKAVPELIKFTKSWNPDRRYQSIRALGLIGDPRAVEPLLEIVREDEIKGNRYYRSALLSLCQIGYEPIRPIILEQLKQPDGTSNGATTMMEYVGKKEDISLLEKMLDEINGDDISSRLDRKGIKKAIEAIKQREGL